MLCVRRPIDYLRDNETTAGEDTLASGPIGCGDGFS